MTKRFLSAVMSAIVVFSITAAETSYGFDIDAIVAKMSLEQKARLLVGTEGKNDNISHCVPGAAGWTYEIPSLGIPSINLADGPVGVRINPVPSHNVETRYDSQGLPVVTSSSSGIPDGGSRTFCTCFPSTTALAATWDINAAALQGKCMADEAKAYGVDIVLAPGINIMRNPLCGRNFEYFSEDPMLTGKLASNLIRAIQQNGIGTSLKHFVANNQQTGKKVNDARITQRALREIYLKAFEICVKESNPWTVMGSYNKIAGQYTQTNTELMQNLLRDEWGYSGLVLTDWSVRRPTVDLINARCSLIMPGEEDIVNEIIEAVNDGRLSIEAVDACVKDVLGIVAKSITANGWQPSIPNLEYNAQASRKIATESMVLLKNENNSLPLRHGSKIALFGVTAYKSIAGGTGSSNVNKPYIIDISTGLENAGYHINSRLAEIYKKYADFRTAVDDNFPDCPDWQKISYHRTVAPEMDLAGKEDLISKELGNSDVAIVVLGRGSGETSDRTVENDFNLTAEEVSMMNKVGGRHAANRAKK